MPDQTEIASLIAAVSRGEEPAFDRLYIKVAPQLFGLVLRMVRNRAQAEDVLQDVFTRIWTKAASYEPAAGEPLAWLSSVARHRAIDHLRRTPSLRQVEEGYEGWFENIADPKDEEGAMMDAGVLRHCLGALDRQTQDCVMLAYCEGYSGRELATRYGKPENTIKSWLRRGLASLKICLDKNG